MYNVVMDSTGKPTGIHNEPTFAFHQGPVGPQGDKGPKGDQGEVVSWLTGVRCTFQLTHCWLADSQSLV